MLNVTNNSNDGFPLSIQTSNVCGSLEFLLLLSFSMFVNSLHWIVNMTGELVYVIYK